MRRLYTIKEIHIVCYPCYTCTLGIRVGLIIVLDVLLRPIRFMTDLSSTGLHKTYQGMLPASLRVGTIGGALP